MSSEVSLWLVDVLSLCLQMIFVPVYIQISSKEDTIILDQDPSWMFSYNFNYIFKYPIF